MCVCVCVCVYRVDVAVFTSVPIVVQVRLTIMYAIVDSTSYITYTTYLLATLLKSEHKRVDLAYLRRKLSFFNLIICIVSFVIFPSYVWTDTPCYRPLALPLKPHQLTTSMSLRDRCGLLLVVTVANCSPLWTVDMDTGTTVTVSQHKARNMWLHITMCIMHRLPHNQPSRPAPVSMHLVDIRM
jgi:hypothetical protein